MSTALELLADERKRQIEKENWSIEHDDKENNCGQLSIVASIYAMPERLRGFKCISQKRSVYEPTHWPFNWNRHWFKPTPDDRIRELVKAGALIVAEIERLQRKEAKHE